MHVHMQSPRLPDQSPGFPQKWGLKIQSLVEHLPSMWGPRFIPHTGNRGRTKRREGSREREREMKSIVNEALVSYWYWVCLLNPELVVKREEYIDGTPKLLREVELIQYETIMVNMLLHMCQMCRMKTPIANSGVIHGLREQLHASVGWLIDTCAILLMMAGIGFFSNFCDRNNLRYTVHWDREGLLSGLAPPHGGRA